MSEDNIKMEDGESRYTKTDLRPYNAACSMDSKSFILRKVPFCLSKANTPFAKSVTSNSRWLREHNDMTFSPHVCG